MFEQILTSFTRILCMLSCLVNNCTTAAHFFEKGLGARLSSENVKTTILRYRQFYDSHVVYKMMNSDKFSTEEKITKGNVKRKRAMGRVM